MKKTEEKVINFIKQHDLIEKGERILIAFSGGPDSVFALQFLNKFQKKYSITIAAVHFNHQLRGKESDEDEVFTSQFCAERGVEYFSRRIDVKKFAKVSKSSIEEAARYLRYSELKKLAESNHFSKIVTAHNLTDNTETILLNLFSGAGISALSGIPIRRESIVRPFLCLTKQEIEEYLQKNGTIFRIDSSNLSDDFKRNYIRNKILPLIRKEINPAVDSAVFRSMKNIDEINLLNEIILKDLTDRFVLKEISTVKIDLRLSELFKGVIPGQFLKEILWKEFQHEFDYDEYEKLNSLIYKQKGRKVNLSGNLIAIRDDKNIVIKKKTDEAAREFMLRVGDKIKVGEYELGINKTVQNFELRNKPRNIEYISGDKLDNEFVVRNWHHGDSFQPIGMRGEKKISDFLSDMKIPAHEKKGKLVLLNRNQIVWVVGLRISDKVKITNNTKRVLKLWVN